MTNDTPSKEPKENPLMPLLRSVRKERDTYRDKCIEQQYRIEELEARLGE